jgi:hypothetical protein
MNKIQRSFSTIGFPERSISTAAIISKIRIIFKKVERLFKKNNHKSTYQTNNAPNCRSNIMGVSCNTINKTQKKNQNGR